VHEDPYRLPDPHVEIRGSP